MRLLTLILPSMGCAAALTAAPLKVEELQQMNFFKNKGVSILGTSEVNKDVMLVFITAQTPQGSA